MTFVHVLKLCMYVLVSLVPPPHRQMLSYACVAEFFSQPDSPAYLTFLSENLEGDTNALQVFLGEGRGRRKSALHS